jgi:hypothetical protein
MSNALVDLRFTLDIPEDKVEKIAGRPDDGSQEWHEHAWQAVEDWVQDNAPDAMEFVSDEPDVEVTM